METEGETTREEEEGGENERGDNFHLRFVIFLRLDSALLLGFGWGGLVGPSCQFDEREKTSVSDGIIAKIGNRMGFMNSMRKRSYSVSLLQQNQRVQIQCWIQM